MTYDPEYYKEYYQANKEKKREQGRIWAEKNKEKVRELHRINAAKRRLENPESYKKSRIEWEERNPEKILLKAARHRAEKRGWEFSIDLSDIDIPETCPLLGIPIKPRRSGHGPKEDSPSLDRIDSSLGYIKGNVWVISSMANRIKTNASVEQIELVAKNLRLHLESMDDDD